MVLIPKEMQEKTGVDFHNLLKTGEITAETVLLDKKGQPHFVEYSSTTIKVGDKVVGTRGIVRDITKRKQAEEKLRESEEMAHALLNAPSDSAWLIEPNGTVVALNEMAARTLDKSPNEIVGTSVFCLFSPEVAARSKTQTDKVIRSGKPFRFEDKRGEKWFYQSAYPVFDAQGNVVRLAIFTRDITEQRRAEEELKKHRHHLQELVEERTVELTEINEQLQRQIIEHKRLQNMLRESQKKYKTLTENINVGIYRNTVGPKGRFIEVNPAIVKMFGYNNREEFLSINVADLYQNPEDRAKFNEKMLRAGFVRSEELELKKRDGTLLIGSVSAVAVKDEKGKTKYYDGVIEDITQRKRVEEALRESEEKYRRLFNSSSDAVFVWQITKDGYPSKFINVNNIACQKYGYTREEFLNLKPGELDLPKGFGIVPKFMKKLLSEKFILFELEHVTKTGQKLPVEINSHLFELAGKPTVISIVRDITERKQAEEQIRLYNEQLEELVERRTARIKELERERVESEKLTATGRMAARIAHEINNPLGGIKNSFLLIKGAIPDDHPYYRYVGLIEKEIERIARIVHQMFDLYRPDQETPGEFWIEEAIGDVITLLEVNCRESGIQVETDTRDASVLVSLPEALFRQVLYNLLMNAIEASSPEGVVRVEAMVADEVLMVTVSDQGSGIPEEMRSQIFEPFFTTKSRLSSGGLGLGLSISKGLVEAMRGSLDFESKPGQGTIFRITLPVKVLRKEV
jgi:PAS domain S-box-containing protein